ncbi:hypothetical protein SAMN05421753_10559 [Planctomicrobium piriforme]|uniref:Ribbon-helix-helix protein, copG family n=2 Tax=Planctomicrobium piriforme TaxID=1576369 RepID=A0A1I3F306_9PLAN|nr:hypothetical protein SAMN05421753_10559 [Planctomicrobium piriforme]
MARKIERVSRKMTATEREEMLRMTREISREREEIIQNVNASAASRTIRTRVTEEMHAALKEYCEQHGTELSAILRDSALRYIGRRDLVGVMPAPGRPAS